MAAVQRVDAVRAARLLDDLGRTFALEHRSGPGRPAPARSRPGGRRGGGRAGPADPWGGWDGATRRRPRGSGGWGRRWCPVTSPPSRRCCWPPPCCCTAPRARPGHPRSRRPWSGSGPGGRQTRAHGDVARLRPTRHPTGPGGSPWPPPTLAATPVSARPRGLTATASTSPPRVDRVAGVGDVGERSTRPEPAPAGGRAPNREGSRRREGPRPAVHSPLRGRRGPARGGRRGHQGRTRAGTHRPGRRPGQPAGAGHPSPDAVRTRLAGVLYLLNLTDRLEFPDDPDHRWRVGELSGWALLELLGRGLLDSPDRPDDEHDPLWRLLAQLDGRPPATPVGPATAVPGGTATAPGGAVDSRSRPVPPPATLPVGAPPTGGAGSAVPNREGSSDPNEPVTGPLLRGRRAGGPPLAAVGHARGAAAPGGRARRRPRRRRGRAAGAGAGPPLAHPRRRGDGPGGDLDPGAARRARPGPRLGAPAGQGGGVRLPARRPRDEPLTVRRHPAHRGQPLPGELLRRCVPPHRAPAGAGNGRDRPTSTRSSNGTRS